MKKNFKSTLTLLLLIVASQLWSQRILMEEFPASDTLNPVFGPNSKTFYMGFFQLGSNSILDNDHTYKHFKTRDISIGLRGKYKVAEFLSWGWSGWLSNNQYASSYNLTPSVILGANEYSLRLTSVSAELYHRWNIGRRGNKIKFFIDGGFFGSWIYRNRYVLEYDNNSPLGAASTETTLKEIDMVETFAYGLSARVGYDRVAVYLKYYLADLNELNADLPEDQQNVLLPPLTVGIEFGLY